MNKNEFDVKEKCKYCNECNAPICPLDAESLNNSLWYSDEDICKVKKFNTLFWVSRQKKIKFLSITPDTYFTTEMLSRKFRMGKKLKGLDPDGDAKTELEKWLNDHQVSKERKVSDKSRDALKNSTFNRISNKKKTDLTDKKSGEDSQGMVMHYSLLNFN
jgi:hypothetical protein